MNIRYKNIEDFKKEFYKKYPKSEIKIIELLANRRVKVEDKYGIYIYNMDTILLHGVTSIKCAENKTEIFINKSIEVHGNKYNYSLSEYKGALNKLTIICKKHGIFEQFASSHLNGAGCKKCGRIKRDRSCTKSVDSYIERLNKIHNNTYSINKKDFINLKTSIPHYCSIQKEWFNMRPSHVLNGQRCRKCANKKISDRAKKTSIGWTYSKWKERGDKSKYFDSFKIYIIKCWNDNEEFYKIGKTFQAINRRFQSKREIPYNWKLYKVIKGGSLDMSILENELKIKNKKYKYTPKIKFNGSYECFSKIIIEDEIVFSN